MNITQDMIINHCNKCDTIRSLPLLVGANHFLEWLEILKAGSVVQISEDKPLFSLEHIESGMNCQACVRNKDYETLTMVVFKWNVEE